ncbi:MAG: polysaccharide biosynthesis/export family protein [Gammaproteobacteria bacterium]|nr:polysaccharide biosynthesis/export family protein [Gammaproteobacteria bacterium]
MKINHLLGVRLAILVVVVATGLQGCAMVPGQDTYGMRDRSSVEVPVKSASGETVPENIDVQEITADLIIRQARERDAFSRASVGIAAPAYGDYLLGPGDIINVIVWDHPELTIPAGEFRSAEASGTLVGEDGNIFFPYVGVLHVDGLTVSQLRQELITKLSRWIENVQLDVRVAAYRSKRVYVVGEVNKPGLQPINDIPMTVIEAVNRAGGFTVEADHANITLTRDGTTYRVDLQALYEEGAVSQNVLLRHGDVLNIPDRQLNKVFVLGEVREPGSFVMNKRRKTLAEALGDAADLEKVTSNPNQIFVMRGSTEKPAIYHLNAGSPDALILAEQFPLQPRDIVFVDAADIARWNRVITNILPTFTLLNQASRVDFPLFQGTGN